MCPIGHTVAKARLNYLFKLLNGLSIFWSHTSLPGKLSFILRSDVWRQPTYNNTLTGFCWRGDHVTIIFCAVPECRPSPLTNDTHLPRGVETAFIYHRHLNAYLHRYALISFFEFWFSSIVWFVRYRLMSGVKRRRVNGLVSWYAYRISACGKSYLAVFNKVFMLESPRCDTHGTVNCHVGLNWPCPFTGELVVNTSCWITLTRWLIKSDQHSSKIWWLLWLLISKQVG